MHYQCGTNNRAPWWTFTAPANRRWDQVPRRSQRLLLGQPQPPWMPATQRKCMEAWHLKCHSHTTPEKKDVITLESNPSRGTKTFLSLYRTYLLCVRYYGILREQEPNDPMCFLDDVPYVGCRLTSMIFSTLSTYISRTVWWYQTKLIGRLWIFKVPFKWYQFWLDSLVVESIRSFSCGIMNRRFKKLLLQGGG